MAGLTRQWRQPGLDLLAHMPEPHDELLTLLWGPRFDRDHALALWAGLSNQPSAADPAVSARWWHDLLQDVWRAADRFDALPAPIQHRLRRVVLRHRRWTMAHHAAHPAH